LERIYWGKNAKGIPAGMLDKLHKLLFALRTAKRFPVWNLHPLEGEFERFWSLTVIANRINVKRYVAA
jgi:hypothetical protein